MNDYAITLFLHIVGALGFFVALGLELTILLQLRRATATAQVRAWISMSSGARRLGMVSMVALLASGFYMMARAQIGAAWLIVAFWTLVLLAVLALTLSRQRMIAIEQAAAAEDGPLSLTLQRLLHHPLLWLAIKIRMALALGIVFLMTVKPPLSASLLAIGVAAILGLLSALPVLRGERVQEEPAT